MPGRTDAAERLTADLVRWVDGAKVAALASDQVPGADLGERRRLAALGGLAKALAGPSYSRWPAALSIWAEHAPVPPEPLVSRFRQSLAGGEDPLELAYEAVVSARNRRRLGTFFTPPPVVEHMLAAAGSALGCEPVSVVDPGAGVGAFTIAALRRWPGASVQAVDVNVVTLGLLAARCAASGLRRPGLQFADYLSWVGDDFARLRGPRLVLGNPPYTRHQLMTGKAKREAASAAEGLVDSGLAGMSAYFLGATLRQLSEEDAACLLLPTTWTEATYGRRLREHLWASSHRPVIVQTFPSRLAVFPGTQVAALMLIVGPVNARKQQLVVQDVDLSADSVRVTATRRIARSGDVPIRWPKVVQEATRSTGPRISDIASVRRGVATGANSFFFLTDAEADQLPLDVIRPAVVKSAHVDGDVLDEREHAAMGTRGLRRWLFDVDPRLAKRAAVARRIAEGQEEGLHLRTLTSLRDPWYRMEARNPADILVSPFGYDTHRVILNSASAVHSNSLYGLYLHEGIELTPTQLASWLRSKDGQQALREGCRSYSGGSLKLEPAALAAVRMPSLDEIRERAGD